MAGSSGESKKSKVSDLEQRVEDLEDLVMVENAGIEELKSLMQDINSKMVSQGTGGGAAPTEIPEDLKEKLAVIDELRNAVNQLDSKQSDLENSISAVRQEGAGGASEDVKSGLSELGSKVASIEKTLDKFSDMEDKMESIDKFYKGSESARRTISALGSRMDAMESVLKNISEDNDKMRSTVSKFDSFDRMSNLAKDLRNKMEEFKFVENEVKRISNRVEGFYQNLDKRLDRINQFEREFPELKQRLDQLREETMKRIDENKVSVIDKATKDETSAIRDRLSQIDKKISDTRQEIDKVREEMSTSSEPMSVVRVELSDIISRIVAIETRIGNLENVMQRASRSPIVLE